MTEVSNIEKNVMRRAYTIRALRFVVNGLVASGLVFLLALWGIGREVWVAKVFGNGPQGFLGHLAYLSYALEHTRLIVQVLVLVTLGSLLHTVRSFVRTVTHVLMPAF